MLYSYPMEKKQLLQNFKNDLDVFMQKEQDEFEIRHFIIDFCDENKINAEEIRPYIAHAPVWNVVPGILEVIGTLGSNFVLR